MRFTTQKLQEEDIKKRVLQGLALVNKADWQAAYTLLSQLINTFTTEPQTADGSFYLKNARLYLGITLVEMAHFKEAIDYLNSFLKDRPQDLTARRFLAFALLSLGKYKEGFQELLYPSNGFERRIFKMPLWSGQHIKKDTLLVYDGPCNDKVDGDYGDGFGDAIQCVRYFPLLSPFFKTIVLQCHKNLCPLFETIPDIDIIIDRDSELPHADVRVPLIHLPAIFQAQVDNIPYSQKYLTVPPVVLDKGFNIGICWQGSASHFAYLKRDVPLELLLKRIKKKNARLFNLQKEPSVKDNEHLLSNKVVHLDCYLKDFYHTARLITSLDLVITVDTAMAHLSGALGVPTWLLLPYSPDWRWLSGATWYEKVTFFKQKSLRDWSEPLMQMENKLDTLLKSRK